MGLLHAMSGEELDRYAAASEIRRNLGESDEALRDRLRAHSVMMRPEDARRNLAKQFEVMAQVGSWKRRGSWFEAPRVDPQAWRAHVSKGMMQMTEGEHRLAHQAKEAASLGARAFDPEQCRRPDFLLPFELVCMHCGRRVVWKDVAVFDVTMIEDRRCHGCHELYWPHGGFREANLVRCTTGDWTAFWRMIVDPPEGLR